MLETWFGHKNDDQKPSLRRSSEEQAEIDRATAQLALYYYETCWFCRRVRATIADLNLNVELRDIHGRDGHHDRLRSEGGSGTVPCLLIEGADGTGRWQYESRDIIDYLEGRFGKS